MAKKKSFSVWIIITTGTVICIMTVLTLSFLVLLNRTDSEFPSPKTASRPAPDFSLPSLNGQIVTLQDLRGKPVIINFWTTWCAPCKEEMPLLESTAKKYGTDLNVIAINQGENLSTVRDFVANENLSLQVLLDEKNEVGELYKVGGYPTSIFIDKDGIIQAIYLGELSLAQLKNNLHLIGIKK